MVMEAIMEGQNMKCQGGDGVITCLQVLRYIKVYYYISIEFIECFKVVFWVYAHVHLID